MAIPLWKFIYGPQMRDNSLAGKTALVTGAARRIGRSIVLALAEAGANLVIHYRNSFKQAEEIYSELSGRGTKVWLLRTDFGRSDESKALIQEAVRTAGPIDFLINNASSFVPDTVEQVTFPQLIRAIQVNAWSPFELSRLFARHVTGRGKIVNLIDTRVVGYDRTHIGYILSKKMLLSLTEIMAVEFAPRIAVNAVAPGLILPPEGKNEDYLNELAHSVPLEQHGDIKDVTDAVLFLLKSDFVTGQVIYVDGGRHLAELNNGSHHNQ
jgi:pteridine reductase